jgi:hypothetical protein
MDFAEILKSKRSAILAVANQYGAKNVRLFGSVVRGEAAAASDIDLLVHMDEGRSLLDLVGFWQDLEQLLGCKVDVLADDGLSPYLRDRILAEAVPL